jgi:erythromycin esterase-like protein
VKAASANDVWAVGQFSAASGFRQTLTEHWNGKNWSVVPSPNVGTHDNILHGVTAVSANDVWAVGDFLDSNSNSQALIEHWNGTTWSVVPSSVSGSSVLNDVKAVSANNVWAVGAVAPSHTLTEHWNGTTWSVVPSPSPGTNNNALNGVTIISAHNIWAVGFALNNGFTQTLIEHWNGKKWSVVASPSPSSTLNFLNGADADPHSGQTWAVGVFFNASGLTQTLTEFHP